MVVYEGDTAKLYERHADNGYYWKATVPRIEAHKWLHGHEDSASPPEIAPTVDEMVEVIAAKLQGEIVAYMDGILSSEDTLRGWYGAAKRGTRLLGPRW